MKEPEPKDYAVRAKVMKALAHPSRLMMVDALEGVERCVCELTEMVGDDVSTVSKHLSVLKGAGIVACEKRGLKVFYRLNCTCIPGFFNCIESVLKQRCGSSCSTSAARR